MTHIYTWSFWTTDRILKGNGAFGSRRKGGREELVGRNFIRCCKKSEVGSQTAM